MPRAAAREADPGSPSLFESGEGEVDAFHTCPGWIPEGRKTPFSALEAFVEPTFPLADPRPYALPVGTCCWLTSSAGDWPVQLEGTSAPFGSTW